MTTDTLFTIPFDSDKNVNRPVRSVSNGYNHGTHAHLERYVCSDFLGDDDVYREEPMMRLSIYQDGQRVYLFASSPLVLAGMLRSLADEIEEYHWKCKAREETA